MGVAEEHIATPLMLFPPAGFSDPISPDFLNYYFYSIASKIGPNQCLRMRWGGGGGGGQLFRVQYKL